MKKLLLITFIFAPFINFFCQPIAVIEAVGYDLLNPVITGVAPLSINVNALNSDLNNSLEVKTLYEWDFGDSTVNSSFNNLDGWTASHIYNNPGIFTLTLKITDEYLQESISTVQINVQNDNRTQIYVSTSLGTDLNDGLSPSQPKRSLSNVMSLVTDNTALNLFAGDTFYTDTFQIYLTNLNNVIIRKYGGSDKPILIGGTIYSESNPAHITISRCTNVLIENLFLTSPLEPQYFTPFSTPWNGIYCTDSVSKNISINNNVFDNIGFCINTWNLDGLMVSNNESYMVGKYLFYGQARNATLIGNTCEGTTDGICIRTYLGPFNISHNNLWTNFTELAHQVSEGVATSFPVSLVVGSHFYAAYNETHGPWMVGYLTQFGLSSVSNTVIEGNVLKRQSLYDPTIRLFPNDQNIMIRNNVFHLNDSIINTEGIRFEEPGAGLPDETDVIGTVWVLNNTFIGESNACTFLNFGCNPMINDTFFIQNNLAIYPDIAPGSISNWDPYMIVSTQDLERVQLLNNMWQSPVNGDPFRINGTSYSENNWIQNYQSELFFDFNLNDRSSILNNNYSPDNIIGFSNEGVPIRGVFKDFNRNFRPINQNWTAGAVELNLNLNVDEVFNYKMPVLYPNPNYGNFTLDLNDHLSNFTVSIFNQQNQVIYRKEFAEKIKKVDLNFQLESGFYFLQLEKNNSVSFISFVAN